MKHWCESLEDAVGLEEVASPALDHRALGKGGCSAHRVEKLFELGRPNLHERLDVRHRLGIPDRGGAGQ